MAKELTARSSIGTWLKHPAGGPLMRELLAEGGQTESALAPVRLLALDRLVPMSGGRMTRAMVDDLVRRANAADAGGEPEQEAALEPAGVEPPQAPAAWTERVTSGRFDGRTVVVTGAGSGIGRAVARRIAAEGGRVIAVDVVQQRLDALIPDLPGAVAVAGDIRSEEVIAAIVTAAGNRIDGLANVAGVMDDMTPLHEVSDDVWSRVMSINVEGTFRLTRAVLPRMLAAGRGSIVNVASEAGLRGSAAGLAYTTSKHAVVGLTRSTAYMYAATGIRVNAVAPGPVATGIEASFGSTLGQERIGVAMQILPDVAQPAQLAASITWLLSDDSTNVTGVILPSDGGWSAT